MQLARFRVLTEISAAGLGEDGTGRLADTAAERLRFARIADIGCGNADLRAWFESSDISVGRYVGVDGVPELTDGVSHRIEQQSWANAHALSADFASDETLFDRLVEEHDVSLLVFSGSLNTFEQEAAIAIIERAYSSLASVGSRRGVVFNFLSDRWFGSVPTPGDPARRFSPTEVVSRCLALSPRVVFRHDYLDGRDATVGVFTDPS